MFCLIKYKNSKEPRICTTVWLVLSLEGVFSIVAICGSWSAFITPMGLPLLSLIAF